MFKLQNCRLLSRRVTRKPIFCDWDGTITSEDTVHLLLDCLPDGDHLSECYMEAYTRFQAELPKKRYNERDTLEKEIQYQKAIKDVEMSSVNECIRTHAVSGISAARIKSQYQRLKIRKGFARFFSNCDSPFTILSVNWTKLFMGEYFNHTFGKCPKIISNELSVEGDICVGVEPINIRTGYDKLQCLPDNVVYVGDSETDVLCMIHSDVAFIIRGGSATRQLKKMGYTVKSIADRITDEDQFIELDWDDLYSIYHCKE